MSIQEQVLLRYRSEDHLRFQLPAILCEPETGRQLVSKLGAMEGIYGVDLYARKGKLSIRFLDTVCDFADVVRHFHAVLKSLTRTGGIASGRAIARRAADNPPALRQPLQGSSIARWLRAKLQELGETVIAMGILGKRALASASSAMGERPRWIKEFMNDLVMLYLIKLHWHHILSEWLPRPWTHRYEWAATLYLIYLSIQARFPQRA